MTEMGLPRNGQGIPAEVGPVEPEPVGFTRKHWRRHQVSVWNGTRFISGGTGSAWLADRLLEPNAEKLRVPWSVAGGAGEDEEADEDHLKKRMRK